MISTEWLIDFPNAEEPSVPHIKSTQLRKQHIAGFTIKDDYGIETISVGDLKVVFYNHVTDRIIFCFRAEGENCQDPFRDYVHYKRSDVDITPIKDTGSPAVKLAQRIINSTPRQNDSA